MGRHQKSPCISMTQQVTPFDREMQHNNKVAAISNSIVKPSFGRDVQEYNVTEPWVSEPSLLPCFHAN